MDVSLPDENARLRALLQEQQTTIRKMAEYNRLLSQRVATYASEINRLKALVAKLQRMQFGKSSEKLREKTARHVREAEERIGALQEEMAEVLGEQHDPVLPQPLRQSSARKPLSASLPRETRTLPPAETACPACGGELSTLDCDVSEQLELISSAFKVIETQRPKLACCSCDHIVQASMPSKPIERSYTGPGLLARIVTAKFAEHTPHYRQSEMYHRQGVELSRATLGRWSGAVSELLEPLYELLRQYREWKKTRRLSMRQEHRAGEKLFIDFCGPTVPVVNPDTGQIRRVAIFVAVMGASNYTYVEACEGQDMMAALLMEDYLSSPQVMTLIHYLIQAGESADSEAFVRELAQRVPQHGDALMTIAQQLEQKGIEKGIELGRQEGRNEGKLEVARTMLQNGLDRNTVMKMTGLTEDDLAQIRH